MAAALHLEGARRRRHRHGVGMMMRMVVVRGVGVVLRRGDHVGRRDVPRLVVVRDLRFDELCREARNVP